ncbi:hypothetical protein SMNI109538_25270 [Smaragdicoccus niigatensis]
MKVGQSAAFDEAVDSGQHSTACQNLTDEETWYGWLIETAPHFCGSETSKFFVIQIQEIM